MISTPQGNESIQQFLQNAMFRMWEQVVRAVGDLPGVLGFEVRSNYLSSSLSD
jgi:hypothetical protein